MTETTTIRISRVTHAEVRRLADERHQTVADTVAYAIRLAQQEKIGRDLSGSLAEDESEWLDADAG